MRLRARFAAFVAVLAFGVMLAADGVQGYGTAETARERAFADQLSAVAQPGDLVFIAARGTWSDLARFMSRREKLYSHVGVIAREGGRLVVIHAGGNPTHSEAGVHADSLLYFMATVTRVGLFRLPEHMRSTFLAYVERARERHLPFDSAFSLKTADQLYCTEMVWRGLRAALGADPIPDKTLGSEEPYIAIDDVTHLPFLTPVALTPQAIAYAHE